MIGDFSFGVFFFFFQAEDGIRDDLVTGVQTCALPILYARLSSVRVQPTTSAEPRAPIRMAICWWRGVEPTRKPVFKSCDVLPAFAVATATTAAIEIACTRSEERRVGKEGRWRGWGCQ